MYTSYKITNKNKILRGVWWIVLFIMSVYLAVLSYLIYHLLYVLPQEVANNFLYKMYN